MQSTLSLLDAALKQHTMPEWTEKLQLAPSALRTAKSRKHLSPAIAGALAAEIGEDPIRWTAIAAVEGEKDSACKSKLMRMARTWSLALLRKIAPKNRHAHAARPARD